MGISLISDNLIHPGFTPGDIAGFGDLAELLGVQLPARGESLQPLFEAFGPKAEFTRNIQGLAESLGQTEGIAPEPVRRLVNDSGIMGKVWLRNLRNVKQPDLAVDVFLLGGTAYWMELRIEEFLRQFEEGHVRVNRIHALASCERRCGKVDGSPERSHPVVQRLYQDSWESEAGPQWPTEAEAMRALLDEKLHGTGLGARITAGEGTMEVQVAAYLSGTDPFSLTNGVYIPTNAPAVHVPLQFAVVVCTLFKNVQLDKIWFSQAGRKLATTPQELAPGGHQNTFAALGSLPRLAAALMGLSEFG